MSAIVQQFEHSLALPFFGIRMKTDLFQSCDHCWVFWICCHIECSTFTASSFRIWNSSTGIPSPLLVLFIMMLPKTHLTSLSRMSGLGEWSHRCGYLVIKSFFFCSSVYSCHLFLVSSASIRSIPFLFFVVSFVVKCFLGISNFLDENSSLSHSIISLYFFDYSLKGSFFYLFIFWSLLAILWNSAFKCVYLSFSPLPFLFFFSQLFVRPPLTTILTCCISFSWRWFWSLPPVQYHEPPSIVLQALCLSDLIPWIYLSLPLYIHKGFDLGHTWIT